MLRKFHIEVVPAGEGFVSREQQEQEDAAKKETDPSPKCGEDQQHDPHEFYGITKFKIGLGIVSNGDKSHIQHDLGVKPSGVNGKFTQYQTGKNTEGSAQHVWRVQCGQSQAVDGKLQY